MSLDTKKIIKRSFPKQGALLGSPYDKDDSILGSILGSIRELPGFGNLPTMPLKSLGAEPQRRNLGAMKTHDSGPRQRLCLGRRA